MTPHEVTRRFEVDLARYAGAADAVAVTSCTMALLLCVAWYVRHRVVVEPVEIPRRTYVGVAASIVHAGAAVAWRDEEWAGAYRLRPYPVWDSARWLTGGLYPRLVGEEPDEQGLVCVSFHASKTLADTQGGAVLLGPGMEECAAWLRRARFDGRTEGVPPSRDRFDFAGWHCYLSPDCAARLLWKLSVLPAVNAPLPWGPGTDSDYPDLSLHPAWRAP